jgi:hypothetical protein
MPYDPQREGERRKEENRERRDRFNTVKRLIKDAVRELDAESEPKPKPKPRLEKKEDSWPI